MRRARTHTHIISRYTELSTGGRSIDRSSDICLSALFVRSFLSSLPACLLAYMRDRTLDCFGRRCLSILLSTGLNCFLAGGFAAGGASHQQRPTLFFFFSFLSCCGRSIDRISALSWRRRRLATLPFPPGPWRMASTTSASPTLPTSRYATVDRSYD